MFLFKFETHLVEPERKIIEQNDDSNSFYIISKGQCQVNYVDARGINRHVGRIRSGTFFGEISLIYGCKRTASVESFKYSTLARLQKDHYHEIALEFTTFGTQLKKQIFQYKDKMKDIMFICLNRIEYFKDIGDDALHDIMYNSITQNCAKGSYLQEPGDDEHGLFLLLEGQVKVFTYVDTIARLNKTGDEFELEKLNRGSIINYRSIFSQAYDQEVFFQFSKNSIVSCLPQHHLNQIYMKHPVLKENLIKFKTNLFLDDKRYYLDYLKHLPAGWETKQE